MNELLISRLYGAATLCAEPASVIDTGQWSVPAGRLVPDETRGYVQFKLGGAWPGRSAYGTALHPGTAANSHMSLLHKQMNDRHMLRVHSDSPQARNHFIGAIVALDYPRAPHGGWKMTADKTAAPIIKAAATLFKQADEVPEILREHLGGIHHWSVSQELYHSRSESGFVVELNDALKPAARELALKQAPEDFKKLNLGYVPWTEAPNDLLKCYDEERSMIAKDWQGCRVTVLCGGIDRSVHWGGAAMVPYGAEKEAEVTRMLMARPGAEAAAYRQFLSEAKNCCELLKKVVDRGPAVCSTSGTD